jgi:hypothetical protein
MGIWGAPAESSGIDRRLGLSDKYPEFRELQYRFIADKKYIKKEKNKLVLQNIKY